MYTAMETAREFKLLRRSGCCDSLAATAIDGRQDRCQRRRGTNLLRTPPLSAASRSLRACRRLSMFFHVCRAIFNPSKQWSGNSCGAGTARSAPEAWCVGLTNGHGSRRQTSKSSGISAMKSRNVKPPVTWLRISSAAARESPARMACTMRSWPSNDRFMPPARWKGSRR